MRYITALSLVLSVAWCLDQPSLAQHVVKKKFVALQGYAPPTRRIAVAQPQNTSNAVAANSSAAGNTQGNVYAGGNTIGITAPGYEPAGIRNVGTCDGYPPATDGVDVDPGGYGSAF